MLVKLCKRQKVGVRTLSGTWSEEKGLEESKRVHNI